MKGEVVNFFNHSSNSQQFDEIKISIASPKKIRSWSYGEVKKPETINYRTFKPERDGLFCSRIFGPVKDYECLCGKYKRMKYRGIVCEKCGVEVTTSKVRRERMGHIELAAPVAHIWFLRSLPSRISTILDMTLKDVEKILYFEVYVVVDAGMTPFKERELITEEQCYQAQDEYGEDNFKAMIGAEAVKELLSSINLEETKVTLREDLKSTNSDAKRKKIAKRLNIIESFLGSDNKPEYMILEVLPIIPPEIRPLVMLDGGRFATSDLNELYRRVINRNNRLKRLLELRAPDIIIRNEKRMLQESVDALFDNGRRGRVVKSANKRPFKSLSDMLKGKQGRFRQNLLGKRVDYSGRSVIVVGPELRLHECGLPKKMAMELFKPFIYAKLELYGIANTIKTAKRMVEKGVPEVWDILEEVIREHPVLLNRAPTLHRLGIQAFEPKLIEGHAIQLHPLVCAAFNADFDGDQMAVHVPLSVEAQLEARVLMMSTNNILAPSNGKPIIVPTQDIILGLYYMTMKLKGEPGEGKAFADIAEIEYAIDNGTITLHSIIKVSSRILGGRVAESDRVVETTAGRVYLSKFLPDNKNIPFILIDKLLTKKEVTNLIDVVYRHCGQKATVIFADRLMGIGYKNACLAGISIGKDDMVVPDSKEKHVSETKLKVQTFETQYSEGLITMGEKYNKVIDAWSQCTDNISDDMMKTISGGSGAIQLGDGPRQQNVNSIYMMADSGARGSAAQIKQLAGMRGLMAKPSGDIIENPITSNFKEGLSVQEYFISTHGARKGLADTALKTANSGYLTRRLVDVSQDCIVTELDCGTEDGIIIKSVIEGGEVTVPLSDRILGRVTILDITHPITGDMIVKGNQVITEDTVDKIDAIGLDSIKVRSVLKCKAQRGACAHCYGRDLAIGTMVSVGEAVGVVAAQSIGEPGTQLTMRTFHIGGAATSTAEVSSIEAPYTGTIGLHNENLVADSKGRNVVMGRSSELMILDESGHEKARYKLQYGARLFFSKGDKVTAGDKIADWDPYTIPIITERSGNAVYRDLTEGTSFSEDMDESTGISRKIITDWKQSTKSNDLRPRITLRDNTGELINLSNGLEARYFLPVGAIMNVNDGQEVFAGDILARIPRESTKTRDITGGLPRVAELFEVRKPKDFAVISESDGYVEFGKDYKSKRRIIVNPRDDIGSEPVEYMVPKGKHIIVNEGDFVYKGDLLMDGHPVLQDLLRVRGIEALTEYMVNEIQSVYRLQGVKIDDKHIEVVMSQMLQKVEITDPGETTLITGDQIDRTAFVEANQKAIDEGYKPASSFMVLQGITKASLQTKSFISAASFQETTRVLTEASIAGKRDKLEGLKENVIVGRLIPSGTGFYMNGIRAISAARDEVQIQNRKNELEATGSSDSNDTDNSSLAS